MQPIKFRLELEIEEVDKLVPLVDLKAQYLSIQEELDEAVAGVISRATFIEGEEVALFEREFRQELFTGPRT